MTLFEFDGTLNLTQQLLEVQYIHLPLDSAQLDVQICESKFIHISRGVQVIFITVWSAISIKVTRSG